MDSRSGHEQQGTKTSSIYILDIVCYVIIEFIISPLFRTLYTSPGCTIFYRDGVNLAGVELS